MYILRHRKVYLSRTEMAYGGAFKSMFWSLGWVYTWAEEDGLCGKTQGIYPD